MDKLSLYVEASKSARTVRIPPELDGRTGQNRAISGRAQIDADTDVDAITAWLGNFVDSENTFENYRKEAQRLLLWATVSMRKPISSLTHEDMLIYRRFLGNPTPAAQWVMTRKVGRTHPDWRPFTGPLSAASQRQAILILNAMFSWLVTAGYLAGNPLSLSRRRARSSKPRVTRYLDESTWMEVKAAIDSLPRESERQREHYFRVRWLFSLLYLTGMRISEVTATHMGDFFYRRDRDGEERWWLEVVGKGDKTRIIPATHELMTELARYRREKGYLHSADEARHRETEEHHALRW